MSKFAILYTETYSEYDHWNPQTPTTGNFQTYKEFSSEEELIQWIEKNDNNRYAPITKYRVIRFEDVTINRTVTVNVEVK